MQATKSAIKEDLFGSVQTADHPLVKLSQKTDRVLIVPHLGGNTVESFQKTEVFLAARVLEALAELKPLKAKL